MDQRHRRIVGELGEIVIEAALDVTQWRSFSDRFCELIPGVKALFLVNDHKAARDMPLIYSGFEDNAIRDFGNYYGGINGWMPFNHSLPLMQARRTEDFLPSASFRNTEFYTDFLRHLPDSDAATAIRLLGDRERSAELAIHYSAKDNERINRLVEPVVRALAPQMSRALSTLRVRLTNERRADRSAMVHAMVDAAFVISSTGRVVAVNQIGQAMADNAAFVRIGIGDRLEILDPQTATKVSKTIAQVERCRELSAGSEAIRIRHDDRLYSISLYPLALPLPEERFQLLTSTQPCLLLIIRPLVDTDSNPLEILRDRFGLTVAEARLALALTRGAPLPSISLTLNIGYETARTQLKAIFVKLNVRRQAELVALLLPFIAVS